MAGNGTAFRTPSTPVELLGGGTSWIEDPTGDVELVSNVGPLPFISFPLSAEEEVDAGIGVGTGGRYFAMTSRLAIEVVPNVRRTIRYIRIQGRRGVISTSLTFQSLSRLQVWGVIECTTVSISRSSLYVYAACV